MCYNFYRMNEGDVMSMINVSGLTFSYEGSYENIFENVSFTIDTNWKLGFIGRNGKGKTTFLNLLLGKYEYSGKIITNVNFDYFPFDVSNKNMTSYQIAEDLIDDYESWKFAREISLLCMNEEILNKPFKLLSKGEQTRILLAILFLRKNNFLLIDEPTNHLDVEARKIVADYLKRKKSFILVSHDRNFIDSCVDHILSINRNNIEIQQGNFSSWFENKKRQDNFEINENERLKKDIKRLEESSRRIAEWSNKVESSKYNMTWDGPIDKGFIGHKSAKMMKRSKSAQDRMENEKEEKSRLLKNLEEIENLKFKCLNNRKGNLIEVNKLSIYYDDEIIFKDISFNLESGDRIQLKGKNGCGKSSILKLILGDDIKYTGEFHLSSNLKISYVSQDTTHFKGTLDEYAINNNIDKTLFKTILRKLDFDREQFEKKLENYSEGQKKKVLLASSLSEEANIFIWDEPLNYIDVFSRMQIENVILEYKPTMIFVEHDLEFSKNIATKVLDFNEK